MKSPETNLSYFFSPIKPSHTIKIGNRANWKNNISKPDSSHLILFIFPKFVNLHKRKLQLYIRAIKII